MNCTRNYGNDNKMMERKNEGGNRAAMLYFKRKNNLGDSLLKAKKARNNVVRTNLKCSCGGFARGAGRVGVQAPTETK